MAHASELGFPLSQDELDRLRLHGRATESQFAQNPLPVIEAIGISLARFHKQPTVDLQPRTAREVAIALAVVERGEVPHPYEWASVDTVAEMLENGPPATTSSPVCTHGAPVVGNVVLVDSVAMFEGDEFVGADPAERDLSIVIRSIAETFAPEATAAFLDAYEEAGGTAPSSAGLDWYALLAAFR